MIRTILGTALALFLVVATGPLAMSAEILGSVSDVNDNPVPGVRVVVKDPRGNVVGLGLSDTQGRYRISGLAAGAYDYELDPAPTSFQTGTAAAYLREQGLVMNWKVSRGAPASALATIGLGAVGAQAADADESRSGHEKQVGSQSSNHAGSFKSSSE